MTALPNSAGASLGTRNIGSVVIANPDAVAHWVKTSATGPLKNTWQLFKIHLRYSDHSKRSLTFGHRIAANAEVLSHCI